MVLYKCKEGNKDMKRFETVAKAFINASKEAQAKVLEMMSETERKTFLEGVGLYRMFTDEIYYKKIETAVLKEIIEL